LSHSFYSQKFSTKVYTIHKISLKPLFIREINHHKVYTKSTQSLHKVYTKPTQSIHKVYTKYTQSLHERYPQGLQIHPQGLRIHPQGLRIHPQGLQNPPPPQPQHSQGHVRFRLADFLTSPHKANYSISHRFPKNRVFEPKSV